MQALNLLSLPKDVMNEIAKNLYDNEEVINLSFTCKELYEILQKIRKDAKEEFDEEQKWQEEYDKELYEHEKMIEDEWERQCHQYDDL